MTPNMAMDVAAVVLLTDIIVALLALFAWGFVKQFKKNPRNPLAYVFWAGIFGVVTFIGWRLHFF